MSNTIKLYYILVVCTFSIPLIGFGIGTVLPPLLRAMFTYWNFSENYKSYEVGIYLLNTLAIFAAPLGFIPIFIIEYFYIKYLVKLNVGYKYLFLFIIPVYLVLILLFFIDEFHYKLFIGNFSILHWLEKEHHIFYFSTASFIASMLFVWLICRFIFKKNGHAVM